MYLSADKIDPGCTADWLRAVKQHHSAVFTPKVKRINTQHFLPATGASEDGDVAEVSKINNNLKFWNSLFGAVILIILYKIYEHEIEL